MNKVNLRKVSTAQKANSATMTTFSANHWISVNCLGGDTLKRETVKVVSNFTLIWNLFEGVLCNNHARTQAFENLAIEIAQRALHSVEIEDCVRFWSHRYLTDTDFNNLFQSLNFRPRDLREHVEAVLRREKNDLRSQLLAVMIIIYRLRNNLFHGLKTIDTLNDQVPNLNMACRALAAIMNASHAPIIAVRDAA
jgi:hypothetical protein